MMRRLVTLAPALAMILCLAACSGSDGSNDATDGGSSEECEGCVDSTGACVSGSSATACGGAGDACSACAPGEICPARECVPPPSCGPDTCTGCCDADGECRPSDDSTCGEGGVACVDCDDGSECSRGTCVSQSCAASCSGCCSATSCLAGDLDAACGSDGDACVDCGTARNCTGGVCTVDPASRWDVVVVSASVSERDTNDATWDSFGGLPDPFVRLSASSPPDMVSADSMFELDTLAPAWDEVVLSDVPARLLLDAFAVEVFDDDDLNDDDRIGNCTVTIADGLFSSTLLETTCARDVSAGQSGFTLRFLLRPH